MRARFTILGLLIATSLCAQHTLDRQVIGSTGNFSIGGISGTELGSSVGEAVIFTGSSANYDLTQGFQQNTLMLGALMASVISSDETCIGVGDGFADITSITGCTGPYTISWMTGNPGDTLLLLDSIGPGWYTFTVTGSGGSCVFTDSVFVDTDPDCTLGIPNAFSPNDDMVNDTWWLTNVNAGTNENTVIIFNRWGDPIREFENYDNVNEIWDGTNESNERVLAGTYFYVIQIADSQFSGWVQVTY